MARDAAQLHRSVNKWGARVVPFLLTGIVGYCTWVLVALLAVNHLIKPPSNSRTRMSASIAVIVIYFLLFICMATSYFRLVQVIFTNPGYVPLPRSQRRSGSQDQLPSEKADRLTQGHANSSRPTGRFDRMAVAGGIHLPPPGLENFYNRDIFECEMDGLPRWCSSCNNFKPDRSHHSSEVARCVYKMDHFCPWAGGMVSETSFKFFIQFCFSALAYCLFLLITMAYFTANIHHKENFYEVNFIVVIALSSLFFLFSGGMAFASLHSALYNTTTVDQIARGTRVYYFAVFISPDLNSNLSYSFPTISYPFREVPPSDHDAVAARDVINQSNRVFAILSTPMGSNPYDLPSRLDNLKTVMGNRFWDWFVPYRGSPCANHAAGAGEESLPSSSMYKVGPVVHRMIRDAGIVPPGSLAQDLNTINTTSVARSPGQLRQHKQRHASDSNS